MDIFKLESQVTGTAEQELHIVLRYSFLFFLHICFVRLL